MKLDDLYPSRWLKASDVSKPILATIQSVGVEEVGDDEQKPVMTFTGSNLKPMVMNRTNALTISGLYGEDTDQWAGKTIVLLSTKVPFQGKLTDAIRVREPRQQSAAPAPKPQPAAPAPAPVPDDAEDVPF